ncbi:hypothetical protein Tco_1102199 [Tanacetum coccineum]
MSQPANDDFSQHLSDDKASYHKDASDNEGKNGNSKKRISTGKDVVVRVLPPVFAAEIHAVEKERKARTILLMAIPKEHLRRFHGMDDAKEIWEAIRTRFGGNANSKKMQKAVLKQQFEAFTISSSEGLEKGYDRFQQLLSQLEAHGAEVSTEDANHKFLRSLPPAWSNLAMTMRTKPDVDTLSIDDLYNNLRVFEQELTSTSKSSASAQNVAFVSHSKSSTNKVKSGHTGAYSTYTPSTSSNNIPEREVPAGFADEVIYSLFAKQSEDLDLLHEDLEQIDDVDIEEMDINWQIAMIAIRMKKFYKNYKKRQKREFRNSDGNKPVVLTKRKLNVLNVHNTSLLLGIHIQGDEMMEKERLILSKINELKERAESERVADNGDVLTIGRTYSIEERDQIMQLIDCDFYEKKMAREAELKKQRVFDTGKGVVKPVLNNANWVNHANQFIPRPVQLNTGRANINSVRPNVNTGSSTQEHGGQVGKATSTNSVNSGNGQDNTQPANQDNSDMPELTIFNKPRKGIFDEASYDDEGSGLMISTIYNIEEVPCENYNNPNGDQDALTKDKEADEVDVHLYKSMIGNPQLVAFTILEAINTWQCKKQTLCRPLQHEVRICSYFVAVDQSAGPADQVEDQPSSSTPLPSSSHPPVISTTIASEPTPEKKSVLHFWKHKNSVNDASHRSKTVEKGKRYKRRKESKGKDIDTGFEDISTGFEEVNTSFEKVNTGGFMTTKAQLKRYGEELQTKISKKQRIDDKDVSVEEKVTEVKEEEPVIRTGKRKKQKARKGINVDKSPQGDSETDEEELIEAMNPTPLDTKSNIVANWKIFQQGKRSIYQIIRAMEDDTVYGTLELC